MNQRASVRGFVGLSLNGFLPSQNQIRKLKQGTSLKLPGLCNSRLTWTGLHTSLLSHLGGLGSKNKIAPQVALLFGVRLVSFHVVAWQSTEMGKIAL